MRILLILLFPFFVHAQSASSISSKLGEFYYVESNPKSIYNFKKEHNFLR